MGTANRRLVLAAVSLAALFALAWSWRESQTHHASTIAEIHSAGLDHCPAHAITRWRGELICDDFYVQNPSLMTPAELGGQQLYDERPRPKEFRKSRSQE